MSKKIFHVAQSLNSQAARQRELVVAGCGAFSHVVCSLAGSSSRDYYANGQPIKSRGCGRRFDYDVFAVAQLVKLLRAERPDLVHTWDESSHHFVSFASVFAMVPLLVVGGVEESWQAAPPSENGKTVFVATRKATLDHYTAKGWTASNWRVIPPGVDLTQPTASQLNSLRAEFDLLGDLVVIGIVGDLIVENRVDKLIWAFDLIRVLRNSAQLLIVGDGPERNNLHRFADRVSSLENVKFIGGRDDWPSLVSLFDVYWHAAMTPNYSPATLHAMAAGVPVVASDSIVNRELFAASESWGEASLLVTPDDRAERAKAAERLLNDQPLRKQITANAKAIVAQRFSAEQMVAAYQRLYESLV